MDESGFILQNYKVKGWYQKGSQPIKQVVFDSHHKTYITGALSTNGFVFAKQSDTINADNFLKFIKNLKERFSKIVLIIDNVSAHFTKVLRKWYEENDIVIIRLPNYSPQLNSIEQLWKNIKQWLGIKPIFTFEKLKEFINIAIKNISLWPKSYGY